MRKLIPIQKYALLVIKSAHVARAHDGKQVEDVEIRMGALHIFQNATKGADALERLRLRIVASAEDV